MKKTYTPAPFRRALENSGQSCRKRELHTQALERMVRETAYNLAVINAIGYDFSRAKSLYLDACELLRAWCKVWKYDDTRAEDFIKRTLPTDASVPTDASGKWLDDTTSGRI